MMRSVLMASGPVRMESSVLRRYMNASRDDEGRTIAQEDETSMARQREMGRLPEMACRGDQGRGCASSGRPSDPMIMI